MLRSIAIFVLFTALLLSSCSAPKQETPPVKVEEKKPEVKIEKPARAFGVTERYYVKSAVLAPPNKVDDPLQAIRVIQLKQGQHEVLVLFRQEQERVGNEDVRYETWMGIEMPFFAPGTYQISNAQEVQFFRFQLAQKGVRYDGESYRGTVTIEGNEDGYLVGSIDLLILGETKSFDKPSEQFQMPWKADFRIQEVPLEATIMKSR